MFEWIMTAGLGESGLNAIADAARTGQTPHGQEPEQKDLFDREMEVSELLSQQYRDEAQECMRQRDEIKRQAEAAVYQETERQRRCTAEVEELRRMTAVHCQSNDANAMSQLQHARDMVQDAQTLADNPPPNLESLCQQRDVTLATEFDAAISDERQRQSGGACDRERQRRQTSTEHRGTAAGRNKVPSDYRNS